MGGLASEDIILGDVELAYNGIAHLVRDFGKAPKIRAGSTVASPEAFFLGPRYGPEARDDEEVLPPPLFLLEMKLLIAWLIS